MKQNQKVSDERLQELNNQLTYHITSLFREFLNVTGLIPNLTMQHTDMMTAGRVVETVNVWAEIEPETPQMMSDNWNPEDDPIKLRPIETAPKDGRYILLFGPSGYTTTPLRCAVCRWYPEYRPRNPWVNHENECFTSDGDDPTHWLPLPVK